MPANQPSRTASANPGMKRNTQLRIIHVVPSIADEASGPSYSVPSLATALSRHDMCVELHVLGAGERRSDSYQLRVYDWEFPKKLGWSPQMRMALKTAAQDAEVMHNHSLWMMPNVYAAWAVQGTNCRLMTAPRGTLARQGLRRSYVRKRLMWWVWQRSAVGASDCFHATAEHEMRDIRNAGFRAPVAIIPNGIDVPPRIPRNPTSRRRLLFLGRLDPIKRIDVLLKSWKRVQGTVPDWELQIVGVGPKDHVAALKRLAKGLGVHRVCFAGPAYGQQKSAAFREADLFVLPSHCENFAIAVAEALVHEVPAIVTKGAPWSGLNEQGCGWWTDHGEKALTTCLRESLTLSSQHLHEMGQRGRQWMERDFSWDRVGDMMCATYSWLVGGGARPSWVVVD